MDLDRLSILLASVAMLFLLGGCASSQKNIRVDKSFSGKVTDVYVRIDSANRVQHKMSLTSRGTPQITSAFKTEMGRQAGNVINKVSTLATTCLSKKLESHDVKIHEQNTDISTRLILTPFRVESHSSERGIRHEVWYIVALSDNATKNMIFSGEFRVLATPHKADPVGLSQTLLDNFCSGIVEQLASAKLLPK